MTYLPPPLIREHDRLAHQVAADVMRRLGPEAAAADPLCHGLVQVFAQYAELLAERLNRVPELHQLAFFDYLGMSAGPPIPASVPLAFAPVLKAGLAPLVPRGTQVAAPAAAGDTDAVVFETSADLPLVCARLKRAVAVDGRPQQVAAVDALVGPGGMAQPLLADAVPAERALHIAQPAVLGAPGLSRLEVGLEVGLQAGAGSALPAGARPEWGIVTDDGFVPLTPESDSTDGLSRSGELVFADLPDWPARRIAGTQSQWLTCRLRPLSPAPPGRAGADTSAAAQEMRYPAGSVPGYVTGLYLSGSARMGPWAPEHAFCGALALDTSKDFFPLGERPRFGDLMCLASRAFGIPSARVVLDIRLTNPAGAGDAPIAPVSRDGQAVLLWEAHTRRGWIALDAEDGTRALTAHGQVRLTMPDDVAMVGVNAVEGAWLRVRLASGGYLVGPAPGEPAVFPAMAPPAIASITIAAATDYGPAPAGPLVLEHSFQHTLVRGANGQPFVAFPQPEVGGAAIYLGLAAPPDALPGRTLHVYASVDEPTGRPYVRDLSGEALRPLRWEVRGRSGWRGCRVHDGTGSLRNPGIVEVTLGDEVAPWPDSTLDPEARLFWLRIVWDEPLATLPPLGRLVLNAVPARQGITLEHELLGSGSGRPGQRLRTARAPVVGDCVLEVGVPHVLPPVQLTLLSSVQPTAQPAMVAWERWSRVDRFDESRPGDRHFILDSLRGIVSFGDGVKGCIPPAGPNNIRMRRYRTGGGRHGNRAAGDIVQLRTTIPYVESVTNPAPSVGGRDADSAEVLRQSAAAWLRHRDRAVARDDYADLARRASPEVARAACAMATDLAADPARNFAADSAPASVAESLTDAFTDTVTDPGTAAAHGQAAPGVVSVVIVPYGSEARPQPTRGLLEQVKRFLDARCPLGVDLVVLGPLYAAFAVDAEIAIVSGAASSAVIARCEQALRRFLHPLTGGAQGAGWTFGERPHASDFYPLLGAIDGVDHVRTLRLHVTEAAPGRLEPGAFLACSGSHALRPWAMPRRADGGAR